MVLSRSYLQDFEKKYKIDLWQLVFSERIFVKYNKFYKFSEYEILSIVEQECRFFEKVLEEIKPDFLVIKLTDFHRNHLLAEICSAKGVKILMVYPSRFGGIVTITEQWDKFDYPAIESRYPNSQ